MMLIASLCTLLIVHLNGVHSSPIGDHSHVRPVTRLHGSTTEIPAVEVPTSQVSTTTISALLRDHGNFIENDEELSRFLARSKKEIEESIRLNPQNYASEDMSIEEIMALFEESSKGDRVDDEEICPICKDDLEAEPVQETSCKHKFHRDCLRNFWAAIHRETCPTCRRSPAS